MINGVHLLLYSNDPVADQAALNDALASVSVPAGDERLIFALPPSEIATDGGAPDFTQRHAGHDLLGAVLYLMCDDLNETIEELKAKGLRHTEIANTDFGERRRSSCQAAVRWVFTSRRTKLRSKAGNRDVANTHPKTVPKYLFAQSIQRLAALKCSLM